MRIAIFRQYINGQPNNNAQPREAFYSGDAAELADIVSAHKAFGYELESTFDAEEV